MYSILETIANADEIHHCQLEVSRGERLQSNQHWRLLDILEVVVARRRIFHQDKRAIDHYLPVLNDAIQTYKEKELIVTCKQKTNYCEKKKIFQKVK